VADAKHLVMHLDEKKPEGVENESVEQISFADKILVWNGRREITNERRRDRDRGQR
jgi:hypothetical protein